MKKNIRKLIVATLQDMEREVRKEAGSERPKSRQGKKTIVGHFDPAVAWQLKKLALDRHTTVQKLLEEALGDLFDKHHLPRL